MTLTNSALNIKSIMRGNFTLKINKKQSLMDLIQQIASDPYTFHLHKNRKFIDVIKSEIKIIQKDNKKDQIRE